MEMYKDSKLLKEPADACWEDEEIRRWCNSGQYYIKYIIKQKLHMPEENFWPAYWLGKNLWHQGLSDEEIRKKLEQYVQSL